MHMDWCDTFGVNFDRSSRDGNAGQSSMNGYRVGIVHPALLRTYPSVVVLSGRDIPAQGKS